MSDWKQIGERIAYRREKGLFELKVYGKIESWKESLLFAWLLAWIACGAYFLYFLFYGSAETSLRISIVVLLVFWGYFFQRIGKTYIYRRQGYEQLKIENGILELSRKIITEGKYREAYVEEVKGIERVQDNPRSFSTFYGDSFWVMGRERLLIDTGDVSFTFGYQLSDEEANSLIRLLRKQFKKVKSTRA